jgi:flagellar biogenesis protein FliO
MKSRLFLQPLLLTVLLAVPAGRAAEGGAMALGQDGKLNLSTDERPAQSLEAAAGGGDEARMFRTAGAMLCLAGLLGGAYLLVRRIRKGGAGAQGAPSRLEVLERLDLGSRRSLVLVRAGNRVLVVADCNQQLRLVANLSRKTFERGAAAAGFEDLLRGAAGSRKQPARASKTLVDEEEEEETAPVDWPVLSARA